MNLHDKDLYSIQEVRDKVALAAQAQAVFKEYSQEKVDCVVKAMADAACQAAEPLARAAKTETGYVKWQDKVVKNTFASSAVYNAIKDMKTRGVIREDPQTRVTEIGVPVGVVAALIPSTNPTSTVIYNALIALKAGNAIVFSPHPSARECIRQAAELLHDAAVAGGAPKGIVSCLTIPTLDGTNALMKHKDVSLILATGGESMVRAAYSSGTPAIGVGPGNVPVFIERSADIAQAVRYIVKSKTFDNGVICASEQAIVTERVIRGQVTDELNRQGAHFLSAAESALVAGRLLTPAGTINAKVVGKSAVELAQMAGFEVPPDTTLLISEEDTVSAWNPYSREKLTPVLAFYTAEDWETGCLRCLELLANEGKGHTLSIHSRNEAIVKEFGLRKNVSRVLVNTPSALGGIGATTDLFPALTLGCGAVGGSSTSDNVSPMNLLNIRRLAYGRREPEELGIPQASAAPETDDVVERLLRLVLEEVS